MTTSVFVIRHGAYDHRPAPGGSEAACDYGLSDLGVRQVEALRGRLAQTQEIQPDRLFCSTLPRARQTAELIAPVFGIEPWAIPELCEWESGNEALGDETFMAEFRKLAPPDRRRHRFAPNCETIFEFTQRIHGRLRELLNEHEGKTIALVVHGGVVQAAFSYFLGFGPGPYEGGHPAAANASITLWRRVSPDADWVQEFSNDTHHLRGIV